MMRPATAPKNVAGAVKYAQSCALHKQLVPDLWPPASVTRVLAVCRWSNHGMENGDIQPRQSIRERSWPPEKSGHQLRYLAIAKEDVRAIFHNLQLPERCIYSIAIAPKEASFSYVGPLTPVGKKICCIMRFTILLHALSNLFSYMRALRLYTCVARLANIQHVLVTTLGHGRRARGSTPGTKILLLLFNG